jgi:4-aminobutyrate aminotransferase/(S)-3-amino-2-methylpropionate transaminase
MGGEFGLAPRVVSHIDNNCRRIASPLPHPESIATLESLRRWEPLSMRGPAIIERVKRIKPS